MALAPQTFIFAGFCVGYVLQAFFFLDRGFNNLWANAGWLVLFLIFAFHKKFRREYFLIFVAGIVFLCMGEIYFRIQYFGPESLKDFKRYTPVNLWSPFSDVLYDRNSFTGLKPQSRPFFKGKEFYINNFGFHDGDWAPKKKAGVVRIMVCGTSVSMGSGVEQNKNYPKQLEYLLNEKYPQKNFEVMNFSMAGYNVEDIVLLLKRYFTRFSPDIILIESGGWVFNRKDPVLVSDFTKHIEGQRRSAKRKLTDISFFASAISNEIPSYAAQFIFSLKAKLKMTNYGPVSLKSVLSPFPMGEDEIREHLRSIRDLVGPRPVFLLGLRPLREGSLFESEVAWRYLSQKIGKEFDFGFIDAIEGDYGDRLKEMIIYPGDNHPNARTHRIYARMIFDALTKKALP